MFQQYDTIRHTDIDNTSNKLYVHSELRQRHIFIFIFCLSFPTNTNINFQFVLHEKKEADSCYSEKIASRFRKNQ